MARCVEPDITEALEPIRNDGLPIYRCRKAEYVLYYTPGLVCVVHSHEAQSFEASIASTEDEANGCGLTWGGRLWQWAQDVIALAADRQEETFQPECLTLYLHNQCTLRCSYCFADPQPMDAPALDLETITAAAQLVAQNCREKDLRLYVVFHGGGEPTLDRHGLERILDVVDRIAAQYEVQPFYYLATSGVMSEETAVWLARNVHLVGLSCDGPAEVHDAQRPLWNGSGSSALVERTGHILREEGCPFHLRATITPTTWHRQAEIADYLCHQFSPEEIHIEPVYQGGRAGAEFQWDIRLVEPFVHHFLQARAIARGHGIPLSCSGSRPAAIHGPYCHLFRQVLNLVPGDRQGPRTGVATACFKTPDARSAWERGVAVGARDPKTGRFEIDSERVRWLRQKLDARPNRCLSCFNRYHCAGDCPDRCPLDSNSRSADEQGGGFRCRVQRAIVAATLNEQAARLWNEIQRGKEQGPRGARIS
ncbi:MAG: radical SAM protein [Anaerolineae bacterium]